MSNLRSFLHLIKRAKILKIGADYLQSGNARRIYLILHAPSLSEESAKHVNSFASNNHIEVYVIPQSIITSLYPGKEVKVISVTNRESAHKITNLMKEGTINE